VTVIVNDAYPNYLKSTGRMSTRKTVQELVRLVIKNELPRAASSANIHTREPQVADMRRSAERSHR
jgi:hypothetical protein